MRRLLAICLAGVVIGPALGVEVGGLPPQPLYSAGPHHPPPFEAIGSWRATEMDGAVLPRNARMTLILTTARAEGWGGCTSYAGGVLMTAGFSIRIGPLRQTPQFCPNAASERLQRAYLHWLETSHGWSLHGGKLTLLDGTGQARLVFAPGN